MKMDVYEVVNTCAAYALYGFCGWVGTLFAVQGLNRLVTKKMNSQEELESIVEQEAAKLKLDTKRLIVVYDKRLTSKARRVKGYDADKNVVRARIIKWYDDTKEDVFSPAALLPAEEKHKNIVEFKIIETGIFGTSRIDVRHELYHLANHMANRNEGLLGKWAYYLLYAEPTATLYALTGIKL